MIFLESFKSNSKTNLGRRNEELRKQDKDKILFSIYKSSRNEGFRVYIVYWDLCMFNAITF